MSLINHKLAETVYIYPSIRIEPLKVITWFKIFFTNKQGWLQHPVHLHILPNLNSTCKALTAIFKILISRGCNLFSQHLELIPLAVQARREGGCDGCARTPPKTAVVHFFVKKINSKKK